MATGYFDGGSRGNPGIAGAGYLIRDGDKVHGAYVYVGDNKTNNESEYTGLLELLKRAKCEGIRKIHVLGDSKLVIMQVQRKWKCNKPHLAILRDACWEAAEGIEVTYEHVPRAENKEADLLSNVAMDRRYTSEDVLGFL
jgi:ribonuclease HI